MDIVGEVRAFNRFYTREIRLLDAHLPDSSLSLPDARVVYELAKNDNLTAADLGRRLDMDKAHLSRILARLRAAGLVQASVDPRHAKQRLLAPTQECRRVFQKLDRGTQAYLERLLSSVEGEAQARLISAMREIETIMSSNRPSREPRLRSLQPGDLGWITHRQAVLYNREYGWDWTYEGLVAEILGKFAATYDPAREDAWVAERDGVIAGSVFLMKSDDPAVAKLRLLYVEHWARGSGLGRKLVATCIGRAAELGYRSLTLWTNDVLVSARRIYQAAGFRLVGENSHHSFGQDLTGQTWVLDLPAAH
jgi:DNA-binding MarR family transcriptional regulator/N-acetylglutamate synthase-like GNAT family acetyltransferase